MSLNNRMAVSEIAQRLGVGRLAVYTMLERGIIPGIRLGRRWIVTQPAYELWERTCGTNSAVTVSAPTRIQCAMAVFKRKCRHGKTVWCFVIDIPGSTRDNRRQIKQSGFPTKAAAERAEAERRVTEQQRYELEKAGLPDVPLPKTLGDLFKDFFAEHAEKKLARKTIERYREQMEYLHPDLLVMSR
jgi:excisionase family DNA binding protein